MTDPRWETKRGKENFAGQLIAGDGCCARIPGHGSFTLTEEAVKMIAIFGGLLHCYEGLGGCRKQGLYFSRTEPKKPLRCLLEPTGGDVADRSDDWGGGENRSEEPGITVSVSRELAPKLDGAVLDFGNYERMQRFVWLTMPVVKGPACTCLRSFGAPAGKRSPCLDDQGRGLTDL